jgi:hypothetical protein
MDQSVKSAYNIIAGWSAFPTATRDWAQRMGFNFPLHGIGSNAPENRLLRKWWEHNKEAILSRQYDKATWLPPASEEVPLATAPSASSQLNPTQPTPAPQVQPAIDTSVGWGLVWPIAIAVVTLASGLFLVRLLTKK